MSPLDLGKKNFKPLIAILILLLGIWGINYYGNHYSHTEEYFKCQVMPLHVNSNGQAEETKFTWGKNFGHDPIPSTEYLQITKWFYGSDISVQLTNLIAYFSENECKINGKLLRCYSNDDSGATNLSLNLDSYKGEVATRKVYRDEKVRTYALICRPNT